MKVTILTPYYPPDVAGVPAVMEAFAGGLAALGHEVRVITDDHSGEGPAGRARLNRPTARPAVRYLRPSPTRGIAALLFAVRVLLDLPRFRPDVIVCGMGWPFAAIGLLIRVLTRIPYVAYFHSEELAGPEGSTLDRRLLRLALNQCSATLFNSRFTAGRLRRLGSSGLWPILIPPGVDTRRFAEADGEAIRHRLGIEGRRVLLTVARLVERKGQDTVIKALPSIVAHVPETTYVVVGGGPAEAGLRALARERGVEDRVIFAGRVDDADLPAYYRACDLFVLATRYDPADREVEGFGIVLLEAAAAGKPVVAGRAGGAEDAVADGRTGILVDPEDGRRVGATLLRLLQDQPLRRAMGMAGAARAARDFDQRQLTERLARVLAAVAAGAVIRGPDAIP